MTRPRWRTDSPTSATPNESAAPPKQDSKPRSSRRVSMPLGSARAAALTLLLIWGGASIVFSSLRSEAATVPPPLYARFPAALGAGTLELVLQDAETQKPLAARIAIFDEKNRPKRLTSVVREGDDCYAFYELTIRLNAGTYRYDIEAGPEYRPMSGTFEILTNETSRQVVAMERAVDLSEEHWAFVEQGVRQEKEEADVLIAATQAQYAGAQCGPFPQRRGRRDFASLSDPRHSCFAWKGLELGDARLILWDPRIDPFDPANEDPQVAWPVDVDSLIAWRAADSSRRIILDSPLSQSLAFWAGLNLLDGITLLGAFDSQDAERYPTRGYEIEPNVARDEEARLRASIEAYQNLLAAGVYLPPTALTRWDQEQRPLGINRTMIATEIDTRPVAPWDGLTAGLTWISNGPLVRFTASQQPAGSLFTAAPGQTTKLDLGIKVSTRYRLDHLELYHNGQLVRQLTLDDIRANPEPISTEFTESGWLLALAWAMDGQTPRIALAAPFRVQYGSRPYVDARAVDRQLEQLRRLETTWSERGFDAARAEHFEAARNFWESRQP